MRALERRAALLHGIHNYGVRGTSFSCNLGVFFVVCIDGSHQPYHSVMVDFYHTRESVGGTHRVNESCSYDPYSRYKKKIQAECRRPANHGTSGAGAVQGL